MKRLIVLNPHSSNGKAERTFTSLRPELESALGTLDVYRTTGPKDATRRVREALREGSYEQILVAGGDGTINEAVNGYFADGQIIRNDVPLAVINLGTGGDFIKSIRDASGLYDISIQKNQFRLVDCGVVERDGEDANYYFINISSIGIAGHVLHSLKKSKFQWGAPAYYYHTLKTLVLYQPQDLTIEYKDLGGVDHQLHAEVINFFVCNGRYSGGGMAWAPAAELTDGVFRMTLLAGSGKLSLVTQSHKVYSGRVSEFPGVREFQGTEVTVHHRSRLKVETDGEVLPDISDKGGGRVHYRILPKTFPLVL